MARSTRLVTLLALRRKLRNLHAKSQYPSSYSFWDLSVHTDRQKYSFKTERLVFVETDGQTSEISAFIRTDGKTVMARSTRLVILIKNIRVNMYFMGSETLPSACYFYGVGNASFCLLHTFDSASDPDQEYIYSMGRKRFLLPVTYFPRIQYTLLLYE